MLFSLSLNSINIFFNSLKILKRRCVTYIQHSTTQPQKKHYILPLVTLMGLESIVLSEITYIIKDENHMISLMWNMKLKATNKHTTDTDNRTVTGGEGARERIRNLRWV